MTPIRPAGATPRSILLATDLTSRCDRAFDRAARLARQWNAPLHVLHAIESLPPSIPVGVPTPTSAPIRMRRPLS